MSGAKHLVAKYQRELVLALALLCAATAALHGLTALEERAIHAELDDGLRAAGPVPPELIEGLTLRIDILRESLRRWYRIYLPALVVVGAVVAGLVARGRGRAAAATAVGLTPVWATSWAFLVDLPVRAGAVTAAYLLLAVITAVACSWASRSGSRHRRAARARAGSAAGSDHLRGGPPPTPRRTRPPESR